MYVPDFKVLSIISKQILQISRIFQKKCIETPWSRVLSEKLSCSACQEILHSIWNSKSTFPCFILPVPYVLVHSIYLPKTHSIKHNTFQINKYISWQLSNCYMFRHRSAGVALVMNCILLAAFFDSCIDCSLPLITTALRLSLPRAWRILSIPCHPVYLQWSLMLSCRPPWWYISFRFLDQNFVCITHIKLRASLWQLSRV